MSLPSLRADNFSIDIMQRLQKVRKERSYLRRRGRGSQRLRDAINKNVTEKDLLHTCAIAFAGGWNGVKLYYMLGLPTETDEDILGIAEMANQVLHCWRENAKNKSRGVKITVSTSCFIPKPHSPFQWEAQISMEEYLRRVNLLRSSITAKSVTYNWHDGETSLIARPWCSRAATGALPTSSCLRDGGRFDSWTDYFSFERWMRALDAVRHRPGLYAARERRKG